MNEDIVVPIAFFGTVIVLSLGIPLVRGYLRRQGQRTALPPIDVEQAARLARIETALESMAIELERISEGQRFTTKLLSERADAMGTLPRPDAGAIRREPG
ncbi:MAG: hypothetical protein HYR75_07905 [Gemmatimonadetes bacterium]|nr:hypothetical protein [Gemmatimonadota bacterium]